MRYHSNVTKNCRFGGFDPGFFLVFNHGCTNPRAPSQGLLLLEGSQFGGSEAGGNSPRNALLPGCLNVAFLHPGKLTWLAGKLQFFIGDTDTSSFCWLVFHCLLFFWGVTVWLDVALVWPPKDGGRVFSSEFWAHGHFLKLKRKSLLKRLSAKSHRAKFTSFISPSKSCQSKKIITIR